MDSQQESAAEGVGGLSTITDLPDTLEQTEIFESTGLSPLTTSLVHCLTLHEEKMGIKNTWAVDDTETPDFMRVMDILPAIGSESFLSPYSDPVQESSNGVEYGPFLPANELANVHAVLNANPEEASESPEGANENPEGANAGQNANLVQPTPVVSAPAGVCGLSNLGNTCFMAAGLQCLTATPPVMQHFLDLQEGDDKEKSQSCLISNFSSLLSKMWSGKYNMVQPKEFKESLAMYHKDFQGAVQHDCQEFLTLLLDTLHEQMNTGMKTKSCHVPSATATTASDVTSNNQNVERDFLTGATYASPSHFDFTDYNMQSPTSPNSPNVTMAGSPRDVQDLDSTANSPTHSASPQNDDEETMDSDNLVDLTGTKNTRFMHNYMREFFHRDIHDQLNDIVKDAKTSNANFLVTPEECNNEIHYDSQKFPKENRQILLETNLTENHDFDNKNASIKRIKEVNCQRSNRSADSGGGGGGGGGTNLPSSGSEMEYDNGLEKCNVKRMRLEDQEKNHKNDGMGTSGMQGSRSQPSNENGVTEQDEAEAEAHWRKHLQANRSVIIDTFQGQFKSTVVCMVCEYVSITYEPFMYLSVPLPNALERQFTITHIPADGSPPVRCVVTLNKQLPVSKLKEEMLKTLEQESIPLSSIVMAEVLENHVAKILEDSLYLRYVDDTNRQIYAFELMDPPEPWVDSDEPAAVPSEPGQSTSNGTVSASSATEMTCTICLEENDGDLKKHSEKNCILVICDNCIEAYYFKNEKDPDKCPVCSVELKPTTLVKVDDGVPRKRPAVRMLNVPLVLRHDSNETTNNRKSIKLFGHLHVLKLPSRVDAKHIWDRVARVVPQDSEYTLRFVAGQGNMCSRCIYNSHCTGCEVPRSGKVILQTCDTLAVRYVGSIPKVPQPIDHVSVSNHKQLHPLSLYDCIQKFSQCEVLDHPWYCSKCNMHQSAMKTITVHRYPKFLIVYLKRFLYYGSVGIKLDNRVTFPLFGLNCGNHLYDLYAYVCHFGGVGGGHYTAYAKNPQTDVWHYYNDEETSRQNPREEDYSNAYILFYSRQGPNVKQCNI